MDPISQNMCQITILELYPTKENMSRIVFCTKQRLEPKWKIFWDYIPFFVLLVQTGKKIFLHSFQSDWNHKAGITCELAQGLSVLWLTLPAVSWKMKQKKTLKKVSMSTKFSSWLHEEKCDKIWIKLLSYSKFQFRFNFRFEPIIKDCKSWQMPFDFDLI